MIQKVLINSMRFLAPYPRRPALWGMSSANATGKFLLAEQAVWTSTGQLTGKE